MSETINVWRIEDKDGIGPFHTKYLTDEEQDELFEAEPWNKNPLDHLPWEFNGMEQRIRLRMLLTGTEEDIFSGATELKHLIDYFGEEKINALTEKGFVIKEYQISSSDAILSPNRKEIAFFKSNSKILETKTSV